MTKLDKRTEEEKNLARHLAKVCLDLPYAEVYRIYRNREVDEAFGCSFGRKKSDAYYAVIAYTTTGYLNLIFDLKGLEKFKRPEETTEIPIERELRIVGRNFMIDLFKARRSLTTTSKVGSKLSFDFHFERADNNFPTVQEVRIACENLKEKMQTIVNLWLKEDNP
ncbi:MAG: hypothetical protein UHO61_08210 [Acutalibacteraceae bacterium]|nr:hypothetical protein [Acutalibacteraceae bacterium]